MQPYKELEKIKDYLKFWVMTIEENPQNLIKNKMIILFEVTKKKVN